MFLDKIEDRSAVIGILGLGYVGLPLASAFIDAGFPVLGFDTDAVEDRDAGPQARTTSSISART